MDETWLIAFELKECKLKRQANREHFKIVDAISVLNLYDDA